MDATGHAPTNNSQPTTDDHRVRLAMQDWIIGIIAESRRWKAYMVTFMFGPLPGSEATVLRQMFVEVERFHRTLLTRVVRKPRSA